MPIYSLRCASCGRVVEDVYCYAYHSEGEPVEHDKTCRCGMSMWRKHGIQLTADMSEQWEQRCRFCHGVRCHVDPPDATERRRQADAKIGA